MPYLNEGPQSFVQGNVPCHTPKSIKDFLEAINILILPWAWGANSPGLNVINKVLNTLERLVYMTENKTE